MRRRPAILVSSFALAFVALSTPAASDSYRFETISRTGDPVPGLAGAQFVWFGASGSPDDPSPNIDSAGNVSFGGGWTSAFSPHGLFVRHGQTIDALAITGGAATGTGSTFTVLPGIVPGPAKISGAFASFDGAFVPPGQSTEEQGVWADRGGPRELIFRQSGHPPGTVAGARFFSWFHTLVGDGHVVVNARYSVGSTSEINQHGIWRDDGAGLQIVALAGTQAPGVPLGIAFGNATGLNLAVFQNWDLDNQGHVTFHALLSGATDLDDEGIWNEDANALQLVVREGAFAPGFGNPNARLLGNSGFRTFGHSDVVNVVRNEQGHIAFGARVDVPGFDNKANAIYVVRGAGLELVTYGLPHGSVTPGQPAPGFPPGYMFKRFPLGVRMNPAGELAFGSNVGLPQTSPLEEPAGVFAERGGAIQLVAGAGQPAPGIPGKNYLVPFPVSYLPDGRVVFISTLTGGGRGLFVGRPDGAVDRVMNNGSPIEIAPGDFRVVSRFSTNGEASDQGAIAVSVDFTDGSQAIVLATPEAVVAVEPTVRGDLRLALAGANPFSRATAVAFELASPTRVKLAVHDLSGREVAVLLDGTRPAGRHVVPWDGLDRSGRRVGAGIYFATLEAGARRLQTKLVAME
jgi:hypothetical protein